jgi:hypothetical protein
MCCSCSEGNAFRSASIHASSCFMAVVSCGVHACCHVVSGIGERPQARARERVPNAHSGATQLNFFRCCKVLVQQGGGRLQVMIVMAAGIPQATNDEQNHHGMPLGNTIILAALMWQQQQDVIATVIRVIVSFIVIIIVVIFINSLRRLRTDGCLVDLQHGFEDHRLKCVPRHELASSANVAKNDHNRDQCANT